MANMAAGLILVSVFASNADRDHFLRAIRGLRWTFLLVPLGIAGQMIPVPLSLAHPIWTSSYETLHSSAFGYVTADLGETLNMLFVALAAIANVCVTIVVTRDRRRAEFVLFLSSAVLTLSAVVTVLTLVFHGSANGRHVVDAAINLAGFGLLLNLATIQLAVERVETRHVLGRSVAIGLAGLIGVLINTTLLLQIASTPDALALALGSAVFIFIFAVRRLDLSLLPKVVLCAALLIGSTIVIAWVYEKSPNGPALLRLVPDLPSESRAALNRIFKDGPLLGAGAGAFSKVARIYQDNAGGAPFEAPSTAAAAFVDNGWLGLAAAIIIASAILTRLVTGGLKRGRDSFFSIAAAACLVFATIEGFVGAGLSSPSVAAILATAVGLGLSQSFGQSLRQ